MSIFPSLLTSNADAASNVTVPIRLRSNISRGSPARPGEGAVAKQAIINADMHIRRSMTLDSLRRFRLVCVPLLCEQCKSGYTADTAVAP